MENNGIINILYVDNNEAVSNTFHHFMKEFEELKVLFYNPENENSMLHSLQIFNEMELHVIIIDSECVNAKVINDIAKLGFIVKRFMEIPLIVLDYDVKGFISKQYSKVYINKSIFDGEHPAEIVLFKEYLISEVQNYNLNNQ